MPTAAIQYVTAALRGAGREEGRRVRFGNSRRILSPQMRENGAAHRIFQPRIGNVAKLPIRRGGAAGKFVNSPAENARDCRRAVARDEARRRAREQ